MIGAPAAWARGYNGTGIVVVVADSGIDPNHPAFAGKIDLAKSRSFVLPGANQPYDASNVTDLAANSHGTHVAGIIASSAASGVPGIGFGANLIVMKMIGAGAPGIPNASAAALDYYATLNNVFIYNGSYGVDAPAGTTAWPAAELDPVESAAARGALAQGKLLVMANGNDGTKSPVASANPSGLALAPFINPANNDGRVYTNSNANFSYLLDQPGLIISVAAVGRARVVAGYSQKCGVTASWCISAPGGDTPTDPGIYSTLPNNNYGYQDGTSMATPAVSGALAVLGQAYPNYSPRDWAMVMFATAENIGTNAGVNAISGYGLVRLDRATDGPTALAAGSDVAVATNQMTYWSQPLATGGGFSKSGAGYLMVAGRTTAAGAVTVNAGALGVGGTLTLQNGLTVAQGASIAGFGRIIGNTTINGTLDPGQLPNYADLAANNGGVIPAGIPLSGTSIGTLTFQGNVTLAGTATMIEGIDGNYAIPGGPGTFDKTIVTGNGATFTAGGTLAPNLRNIVGGNNTYSPAIGTTFLIVQAQNGATVTGNFAGITQPPAGLAANTRLDVVYAATGITLNVTPLDLSNQVAATGQNQNVQNVANAIDAVRPAPGNRITLSRQPLFDDLYDNTAAQDDTEFTALSGEGQANNAVASLDTFNGMSDVIGDRQATTTLAYTGLSASELGDAPKPAVLDSGWSLWGQGFGRWSRIGTASGIPGSHTGGAGFAIGADRAFGDDFRAGAAFGYTHSRTNAFLEVATADSYAVAAYATWTTGGWILDGRLAFGPSNGDTARFVTVGPTTFSVLGSTSGWGGMLAVQAGYPIRLDDTVVLTPFGGVTAQFHARDAFTETTPVGLSFPDQTFARLVTELGARLGATFDVGEVEVRPSVSAAWTHDAGDAGLVTHVAIFDSPFEIDAADPGRDAALISAELSAQAAENLDVFVGYTGEFRRNATSHEVSAGFRLNL
ncbi:MAG: autotransporter domain-containing protein, partial [Alphaproteobacteria bacterium]|nr:autotransporter domain-containing protein [Alphaproteobacteria bacterium]